MPSIMLSIRQFLSKSSSTPQIRYIVLSLLMMILGLEKFSNSTTITQCICQYRPKAVTNNPSMSVALRFISCSYPVPCRLVGMGGLREMELCSMQLFKLLSLLSPPSSGSWKVLMGQTWKGTHHFYSRTRSQHHNRLWWRLRNAV